MAASFVTVPLTSGEQLPVINGSVAYIRQDKSGNASQFTTIDGKVFQVNMTTAALIALLNAP